MERTIEKSSFYFPPIPRGPVCLVSQGIPQPKESSTTEGKSEKVQHPRMEGERIKMREYLDPQSRPPRNKLCYKHREERTRFTRTEFRESSHVCGDTPSTSGAGCIQSNAALPGTVGREIAPLKQPSFENRHRRERIVTSRISVDSGDENRRPSETMPMKTRMKGERKSQHHVRLAIAMESLALREEEGDQHLGLYDSLTAARSPQHRTFRESKSCGSFRSRRVGVIEDPQSEPATLTTRETQNLSTVAESELDDGVKRKIKSPTNPASTCSASQFLNRRNGLCEFNDPSASERMATRIYYKRFNRNVSKEEIEKLQVRRQVKERNA